MYFLSEFVACRWVLSVNKMEGVVSCLLHPEEEEGKKKGTITACQKKANSAVRVRPISSWNIHAIPTKVFTLKISVHITF